MSLPSIDAVHDAPINRVWSEDRATHIAIDCFAWSPDEEECSPSVLHITGATTVTANDEPIIHVEPQLTDGSRHRFEQTAAGVTLLVVWSSCQARFDQFVSYAFSGAAAHLSPA